MSSEQGGLRIARERIAEEAERHTGQLDLGRLGLTKLPHELYSLHHLRELNLGNRMELKNGQWREFIILSGSPNWLHGQLDRIGEFPNLTWLDCSGTQVADLTPLASLTALQALNCSGTQVADLTPLASLTALQTLECSGTQVADLTPLASLTALQALDCSYTRVADLTPLASLTALNTLDCSHCRLTRTSAEFWKKPSLERVRLNGTYLPGVPPEVLEEPDSDVLASLRAHFDDLGAGKVPVTDAKLLVLGNGRAGKTQLCRRLRKELFQDQWDSTHGVIVTSVQLPSSGGASATTFHIWDFGGQDIYYGTHALFIRSRAVFLLVWEKDTENTAEYEHAGIRFRNYPLQYWVEYVRHLGDTSSPVLIVQTKCDAPGDEVRRFPIDQGLLETLGYCKELHYSAIGNERGRASLDEALQDAIQWLHDPRNTETATIGAGRMRVQRRLERMRDADAAVSEPEKRRHRIISQTEFRRICRKERQVSSPDQLLGYLHNSGVVFYRKGLFGDAIVLDQAWALEAIYAVFNRERCYRQLRQLRGRFTRSLLELLVWGQYSVAEQRLFLSMMQSCGMCFVHRGKPDIDDDETEYIAPDLLPDHKAVRLDLEEKWNPEQPSETIAFEYPLLHSGVMRGIIAHIGTQAGMNALYWRDGLCVYEIQTRSHALIEQEMSGEWSGRIRIPTQSGQSGELLGLIAEKVEEVNQRMGLQPRRTGRPIVQRRLARHIRRTKKSNGVTHIMKTEPQLPEYGPSPSTQPQWYVSYAWGDDTPEGRVREEIVEFLCAEASKAGKKLRRDKDEVGFGESISKFMQEIGRGDRVFVVLSNKYLNSTYCMFELFEVRRNAKSRPDLFRERIRVYSLPDALIWTNKDRIQYGIHWHQQYNELQELIRKHPGPAGIKAAQDLNLMGHFYMDVADILATIADILHPRRIDNLEKLKEYWFKELGPS